MPPETASGGGGSPAGAHRERGGAPCEGSHREASPPEALRAVYDSLLAHITGRHDGPSPDAAALVIGDTRASAAERIHVYQHMYHSRIVEALEGQFARIARWLGAEAFAELAGAYIADEPSRHPSLRFVGQRFPDWLATRAPNEPRHCALADLARLEWAREDVFDAADEPTLTLDAIRSFIPDRFAEIPLRLVAAHRRVRLARPVAALWDAIGPTAREVDTNVLDALAEATAARAAGSESLLVWRQGNSVFHRATDAAESAALDAVASGTTFGAVCEALSRSSSEDEAAAQAFTWLSTWANDELLVV
jgi:hypothetical protein